MATDKLVDFDHVTDYISREAALSFPFANGQYDHENANEHFINGCESYKEWLEAVPAADVRPVVHGKWWPAKDGYYGHVMCSACHKIESHETGFCPNCGCQMNGGRK